MHNKPEKFMNTAKYPNIG